MFFSAASAWEIVIKAQLGRLRLPDRADRFLSEQVAINAMQSLPVSLSHALQVLALPNHHRDPFDRILVAQSQVENLPIVTADRIFARYGVETIW